MKKRLQKRGARKGFTLVELLIVIIIIGILAGAMMMVAGRSRDTAEATRIISDLRTMKSAVLVWLADASVPDETWDNLDEDPTPLNAYLDKPLTVGNDYRFEKGTVKVSRITGYGADGNDADTDPDPIYGDVTDTAWILGYDLTNVSSGVKAHLAGQAKSVGLYKDKNIDLTHGATGSFYDGAPDANTVYVVVK